MFGTARPHTAHPFAHGAPLHRRANDHWLRREEAIMGTAISVELWSDDRLAGEVAMSAVMDEMHRIDRAMSPYKPESELSHINAYAAVAAVPISGEMLRLLTRAAQFSQISHGAFDISYAAVGRLYDYRLHKRPTPAELELAREAVGYCHVLLDVHAQTVRFARPGMCIDLGGFAKGYAVDRATAILRHRGIAHANVSAGGDSRLIGDRRGRPWMIGIRDPRRPGEVVAVLPLQETSISTSGDYERYFIEDGERFHHLIDPASGRSPSGVHSVTILAQDGLSAEAFSKCVFVLGLEKGMQLIAAHASLEAVVVDAQGGLHFSSGLLARGRQNTQGTFAPWDRPGVA